MSGYRGRFAPSPTGPLHFGSLVAAVASYLDAQAHGGQWLVRMEDIDAARCAPHWADDILRTLEAFGFAWDGEVWYQSSAERQHAYMSAIGSLEARGAIYPCACSRKEIEDSAPLHAPLSTERRYPGTCRNGLAYGKPARSWRVRVDREPVEFADRAHGVRREVLEETTGDFVLRQAGGPFAYQLAVVVDDADQGVTDVVRGADLMSSTGRQIYLQRLLGYPQPHYWHIPVAVNGAGEKLSKQTGATALDANRAPALLAAALRFLGLDPPDEPSGVPVAALLAWAAARFPPVAARSSP